MRAVERVPQQPSLRRMRRFDVRPDRDLGQNFLIDSNILGVIERAAELAAEDVVLEIGGGLGVLSEHLAERCAHLHVIELDTRLGDALRDATERFANVTLHFEDAMRADTIFTQLMGEEVAPRKSFIQSHYDQVRNLDV